MSLEDGVVLEQTVQQVLQDVQRRITALQSGLLGSEDEETPHGRIPRMERQIRAGARKRRQLRREFYAIQNEWLVAKAQFRVWVIVSGFVASALTGVTMYFVEHFVLKVLGNH